jgi:hypothetical protein
VLAAPTAEEKAANGGIQDDTEDWSRTGWAPRFGAGIPEGLDMKETMIDSSTWLEERISDKFFGGEYMEVAFSAHWLTR